MGCGSSELRLCFFGLTDADAAVMRSGDEVLMIDTGAPEDEKAVLEGLKALNIGKIDLLLLSHPDRDHIGGAARILDEYPVGKIIMSGAEKGSELEAELLRAIEEKGIPVLKPPPGRMKLRFGSCGLQLLAARGGEYRKINDESLAAILTCGRRRVFFGGDVEHKRIEDLLAQKLPSCDIVKVPHHGRDGKLSEALLTALRPKLCIVTSDRAGPAVRAAAEKLGSELLYTGQGAVKLVIEKNQVRKEVPMDELTSVLRTENKYLLEQKQYFQLKHYFGNVLHGDPHNGSDGYLVRSLYFDTVDDRDYNEKLDGLEERRKLRLRIYSPTARTAKLELKEKSGSYQRKRSLTVSREQAQALARGDFSALADSGNSFADELRNLTACQVYRPKCIVEYRRIAYSSSVNRSRVTFDFNLRGGLAAWRFFDEQPGLCPVLSQSSTLMEVKFDRFLLSYIKDVISACDSSPIAFSKYCAARTVGASF